MTALPGTAAALPLLIQRLALAAFMGVWAIDKFVNPEHSVEVFRFFYSVDLAADLTWIVGILQSAVLLAFLLGFMKTWSYILLFLMHAVSTLSTVTFLVDPYDKEPGILFWAAVPVLAAFWLQFALRRFDTIALDDRLAAAREAS